MRITCPANPPHSDWVPRPSRRATGRIDGDTCPSVGKRLAAIDFPAKKPSSVPNQRAVQGEAGSVTGVWTGACNKYLLGGEEVEMPKIGRGAADEIHGRVLCAGRNLGLG